MEEAPLPAILHWKQYHFVVLIKSIRKKSFLIADPAAGIITLPKADFLKSWLSTSKENTNLGIALLLEPTPQFYQQEDEKENKVGWNILLSYLNQNKKFIFQLFLGLLLGSLLQLIFPFLTQSIVDVGINTHNLQFIYIILIAQCMLFIKCTQTGYK
jgi:ATP-binding cassette subfamily B protein